MLSFQFGIGAAYIIPSTVGNPPSPSFPQRLLTIADAEVTFDGKLEKLMGQNRNPDDVAPSDEDVKFKLSAGRIGLDLFNTMFGETITTGSTPLPIVDEGPTAIPTTPFQITVVKAANFTEDLGVLNAVTLQPMQLVSSSPTAGQYSVNPATGVYTFSSADNVSGISVKISYLYTPASGGRTLTRQNRIQGYGPVNSIVIVAPYTSAGAASPLGVLRLRATRFSKMGLPMKRNGYAITPLEGEAFPDAGGNIWDIWSPQ
jgi:hypothetical protein